MNRQTVVPDQSSWISFLKLLLLRNVLPVIFLIGTFNSDAQNCNLKKTSRKLMGKTIQEAVDYLQIDSVCYRVVQEPYGVLRGIRGSYNNTMFLFYVERTAIPLVIDTSGGEWRPGKSVPDLLLIWNHDIIGVSMKCGNEAISRGTTGGF